MIKLFLVTSLTCILTVFSHAQSTNRIIILSQQDSSVVPFAQVYNVENYKGSISDVNGRFVLLFSQVDYTIEVRHIGFETTRLRYSKLNDSDTIYLLPSANVLESVVVNGTKTNTLYKSVNKLVKSLRKTNLQSKNSKYVYYLESEFKDRYIEQIKSVISFDYSFNSGFRCDRFYTEYGTFLFDAYSPFVNLQTNDWLLGFDPFSQKKFYDIAFLQTNAKKIKRKGAFLQRNTCDYCSDNEMSVTIHSRQDSSNVVIVYDKNLDLVKAVTYSIEHSDRHSFLRLNDDVLPVKKITIDYVFNQLDQSVEFINFSFVVGLEAGNDLTVKGFFKKEKVVSSNLYVFGNYTPSSIYEQIILNPSNYKSEIDSIFNKQYMDFDVSNKGYLSSTSDETKKIILGLDGTKQVKIWDKKRLTIDDFKFAYHKNDYYKNQFGMVKRFEDIIDVSWIFNFKKINNVYKVESMPSVWNSNQTLLLSRTHDTLFSSFKANIIFDFYEIKRLELITIVKEKLSKNVTISDVKKEMELFYKDTKSEAQSLSATISVNEIESFYELSELNTSILLKNNIDNLLEIYYTQFNMLIEFPTYYSILDKYVKLGYQLKHKPQLANACFNKAIRMSNLLIKYYKTLPGRSDKQLGAYYSVLSELYHEIGELDKECECLSKLKVLWPEGFIYHKKDRYEIRCE